MTPFFYANVPCPCRTEHKIFTLIFLFVIYDKGYFFLFVIYEKERGIVDMVLACPLPE